MGLGLILITAGSAIALSDDIPSSPVSTELDASAPAPDASARATAVALNYCRASFHRIRQQPVAPVLHQEQEKILNNLNLQGIEDPEVIALYTSVLDEINQIQTADRERELSQLYHSTNMQRKVTWDMLALGTDVATGQVGSAIRTGANSWWDSRNMVVQRDNDLMKVDKSRMNAVTQKSSSFLDTFWKLARKKNIPDRWLVRGTDLDDLDKAMREPDTEVRCRILKRMQPYMEAYPPYWYYLAKTEQELGELVAASDTITRLAELGDGHFRKDDMLAASLANLAAIQQFQGDANAPVTAQRALNYSSESWEANLICARVLEQNRQFASAEDAILRNLDVELEQTQSRVFLASLYVMADEKTKLAKYLDDKEIVAALPAPILLRCAACLGVDDTPEPVLRTVLASLNATPHRQVGSDELIVRMAPSWQLHLARVDVSYDGQSLTPVPVEQVNGAHQLRFAGRYDFGGPSDGPQPDKTVAVKFTYPDSTIVNVTLKPHEQEREEQQPQQRGLFPVRVIARRPVGPAPLSIARITLSGAEVALTQTTIREQPIGEPILVPASIDLR